MLESIKLFATIVNNKHLEKCSFIVFFNKEDLLREKIKHSRLEDYIKDYPGRLSMPVVIISLNVDP
jgi:hypothetical protein